LVPSNNIAAFRKNIVPFIYGVGAHPNSM